MVSAAPALASKSETWAKWRGSPALLSRVARAAAEAVRSEGAVSIEVVVEDDREHFDSPSRFIAEVTPEALRSFSSLSIVARAEDLTAAVSLVWHRPWWRPAIGPDASVTLTVSGAEQEAVDEAHQVLRRTVLRGIPNMSSATATAIGFFGAAFLAGAGTWAALVFLKARHGPWMLTAALAAAAVAAMPGALLGTWVWPGLEVAPLENTHLRKALKALSPVFLLIIGAAIKKISE